MTLPVAADLGLPEGAVVAISLRPISANFTVYRLIADARPSERDFRCMSVDAARRRSVPELFRVGLSHWLAPEQALLSRRHSASRVVAVVLPATAQVARTGRQQGHVTVWADPGELVTTARVLA